jgi:protein dithiol oxidoreductase (disulfide-forming)
LLKPSEKHPENKMLIDKNWLKGMIALICILPLAACADNNHSSTTDSANTAKSEVVQTAKNDVVEQTDSTAKPATKSFEENLHYVELFDPVPTSVPPGKIEVVEMFWYGCPHCYELEPALNKWVKTKSDDIEVIRIPAVFKSPTGKVNPLWALHAKTHYALEAMGVLGQTHEKLFEAIHEQGRRLTSEDAIARFLASLGINEAEFRKALVSMPVNTKTNRAIELTEKYGVTGVPALIVGGRYRVLNKAINSYDEMLQIVDFLAEKERSHLKNDN